MAAQDKFVMGCVAFGLATCTVFAFVFGERGNAVGLLSALGAVIATLCGTFHFLFIRDQKTKDEN